MRKISIIAALLLMSAMAFAGNIPEKVKPTKNLIIMVPDGVSPGVLSATRWYQRYMTGLDYDLNLSDYICGLVETSVSNSPMPCSAAAMSSIMTGVPSKAGYVSTYPHLDPPQDIVKLDSSKTLHPLMTAMEAGRVTKGKSTGLVVTTKLYHATPAACVAHTDDRNDSRIITYQAASAGLDVLFGALRDGHYAAHAELLKRTQKALENPVHTDGGGNLERNEHTHQRHRNIHDIVGATHLLIVYQSRLIRELSCQLHTAEIHREGYNGNQPIPVEFIDTGRNTRVERADGEAGNLIGNALKPAITFGSVFNHKEILKTAYTCNSALFDLRKKLNGASLRCGKSSAKATCRLRRREEGGKRA